MGILLHINKITFEKSENLEKKITSQKLAKILTKIVLKKVFFMFFLNCPGGISI